MKEFRAWLAMPFVVLTYILAGLAVLCGYITLAIGGEE